MLQICSNNADGIQRKRQKPAVNFLPAVIIIQCRMHNCPWVFKESVNCGLKGKALESSLREKRMVTTGTQCGKQPLTSTSSNHQRRPRRSLTEVGASWHQMLGYIFWINGWISKVNSNWGSNRNSVENYCLFTVFHPTYTIFLNYFKLRSELQWVRSHLTPLPTHSLSTVLAFKWHTLYNNKKNITSFHSKLLVTLKGGPRRTLALCLRRCRPSAWAPLETLNQWNVSEQRWTQAKPVQKRRKTGRAMHC